MSQLIDIYLDPAKAWAQLKERTTILLPALIEAQATTIQTLL
jgi:hypothetical protein